MGIFGENDLAHAKLVNSTFNDSYFNSLNLMKREK